MAKSSSRNPVLVTTRRGVFFGYLKGEATPERVTLTDCRMVVRWKDSRGVVGLCADGPGPKCRISPAAPESTLLGTPDFPITLVAACTAQAAERFEAAPWGA